MAEELGGGGLEEALMGNVSEQASESNEAFAARIAAAQARVAQVKKDEKSAKDFDHHLAKLVPGLSPVMLDVVILLIDHDVPSLTILAVISIINKDAHDICHEVFHKHIDETANFADAKLPAAVEQRISYWWTFIYGADHLSKTIELKSLKEEEAFLKKFSKYLTEMLQAYLIEKKVENFDDNELRKILMSYQVKIFEG